MESLKHRLSKLEKKLRGEEKIEYVVIWSDDEDTVYYNGKELTKEEYERMTEGDDNITIELEWPEKWWQDDGKGGV